MEPIKAIDLCCGAGGWACASRGLPIRWLLAVDWAEDCLETWHLNHGQVHPDCRLLQADIASKKTAAMIARMVREAEGVDLVCGAIPCEQLSSARANRPLKPGELESVHALIDACFGLVKQLRPRWWVFEDVVQVEGHLPTPLHSGMAYECRRIDSSEYGPQRRIRTFFGRFPELAEPEPGPRVLADVLRPGPYRTLPQLQKYERSTSKWYGGDKLRVQDQEQAGATVISSQGGMGSRSERSAMVPLARVLDAGKTCPVVLAKQGKGGSSNERTHMIPVDRPLFLRERPQATDEPARTVAATSGGREALVEEDWPRACDRPQSADSPSRTIAERKGGGKGLPVQQDEGLVRIMEWQEAAALQGFPPDYVFAASWSRTWKLVSQAIQIDVGRAILRGVVREREV